MNELSLILHAVEGGAILALLVIIIGLQRQCKKLERLQETHLKLHQAKLPRGSVVLPTPDYVVTEDGKWKKV